MGGGPGFWIPAYAGMTVGAVGENDGVWGGGVWIPAFAGMTGGGMGMTLEEYSIRSS